MASFASLGDKILDQLLKERGANSFLQELTPIDKGGSNNNGRVSSTAVSVPIHFKYWHRP